MSMEGIDPFVYMSVCMSLVPPEMSQSHDEYTVIVDNPILMSCEVTGIPAPQVTWFSQGADVKDADRSGWHVLANGALRIDHVTTEDAGMYECVATNVAGNATMAVTLNVQGTYYFTCLLRVHLSYSHCVAHTSGTYALHRPSKRTVLETFQPQ